MIFNRNIREKQVDGNNVAAHIIRGSLLLDFILFPLTLIPSLSYPVPSPQVDERYRKNIQGSPQTAPPSKQPPLPPRSSEPFSNGGSSEASAMHRPMEPQVIPISSSCPSSFA